MAPRRRPRQPPELMAELIEEILLRVPPDDPAGLARASAVCKAWHRLLSNPAFRRRYSVFHQAPSLLGFLHDHHLNTDGAMPRPRFVPTLTPSPFPHRELDGWHGWRILDCRHGRVLFEAPGEGVNLVVWDAGAGTGKRHWLPDPLVPHWRFTAAVLCAAHVCGGCDHLSCHGGPFLVVLAGFDRVRNVLVSQLYSSEAGGWTVSADLRRCNYITSRKPNALIGDDVYFVLVPGDMVLRYSLGRNRLFIMHPPAEHEVHGGVALVPMEDGSLLGLAGLKYSKLYLWSRNFDPRVFSPWVRCRVVELRTLIPFAYTVEVVGCAESFGAVFVSTDVGVFTVDLKSGRERKVAEAGEYYAVFPIMSFCYTPGCSSGKLPSPVEAH